MLLAAPLITTAQALRDINYSYLYNNTNPFTFELQTVRDSSNWTTFFQLVLTDTTRDVSIYEVGFETRSSLGEKTGTQIPLNSGSLYSTTGRIFGQVTLPVNQKPLILAARVTNQEIKRAWYYYTILEPNYPVNIALEANGQPVVHKYTSTSSDLTFAGSKPVWVSYYNDDFPPAPLPFSEQLGRVSKAMVIDSSFQLTPGDSFNFEQPGLYLLQKDTSAAEGLSFRVDDDYPRYRRVENLAEPLIYLSTKQEFNRIRQARGDKRAFDRVVLSITRDAERAKSLMKNYFRRVEQANMYFTSYKEGWKTDRGMILIIFGHPTEVYRLGDREVWYYGTDLKNLSFEFVKSPSLFDPENYVLIRNKKYEQPWYEVVDLWRNARY